MRNGKRHGPVKEHTRPVEEEVVNEYTKAVEGRLQMLLSDLLESTGYPVAYREFKKSPTVPYIVYYRDNDENIASDYKVHGKFRYYIVELYTDERDLTAELAVEAVLETIDPNYTTDETYIESEELHQVVYEITLKEKR